MSEMHSATYNNFMRSGNRQAESQIRPRNLFLITCFSLFLVLGIIDYINYSQQSFQWFDGGNFFLAQCVAVFITMGVVAYRRTPLRYALPWFVTTLICMWLIGFSFSSYNGRRIQTEADGPASIKYSCVDGELYSTSTDNENLCVLKNMPLAASNATYYYANADTNKSATLMFLLWQVTLLGGFAITKVFTRIPNIHQKNTSQ